MTDDNAIHLREAGAARMARCLIREMHEVEPNDLAHHTLSCQIVVAVADVRYWIEVPDHGTLSCWRVPMTDRLSESIHARLYVFHQPTTNTWWHSYSDRGSPNCVTICRNDGTSKVDVELPED